MDYFLGAHCTEQVFPAQALRCACGDELAWIQDQTLLISPLLFVLLFPVPWPLTPAPFFKGTNPRQLAPLFHCPLLSLLVA